MIPTKNFNTEATEAIPFALLNVKEVMDLEKLKPPEGYYDKDDEIWKLDDGSIPDYHCSSAGQENTWEATVTQGGDTVGDPHPD